LQPGREVREVGPQTAPQPALPTRHPSRPDGSRHSRSYSGKHQLKLVSCPVDSLAISASNCCSWQGRRTKAHWVVRQGRGRSQGRQGPLKYKHDLPDRARSRRTRRTAEMGKWPTT
jgi:hypothetical protein